MDVLVHPVTDGAVGKYRLTWPAEALIRQGAQVRVGCLMRDITYRCVWRDNVWGGSEIVGLREPLDCDVLVVQRVEHRHHIEFIRAVQATGTAVVVDVDDDFHAFHPRNEGRIPTTLENPDHNRDWLMRACEAADLVTVSTPALAQRYGSHGRVRLLPNCVPEWYLDCGKAPCDTSANPTVVGSDSRATNVGQKSEVVVGWAGSLNVHPTDLQATGGGVARAIRQTGARFHVVGSGKGVKDALGLDAEPTTTGGWLPLDEYPAALAQLDVGIVPLAVSEFNEAKSWLKGLEMAALGVPFVASPTGPYKDLMREGAGVLASVPDDWRAALVWMMRQPDYLEWASGAIREMARPFTIERNAERWHDAWAAARENRRGRRAA